MIGVGTSLLFGRKAGKAGPPIMMLSEGEEVVEEVVYPYPLVDENEINSSDDWTSDEVI
jgi:hypothetical protein